MSKVTLKGYIIVLESDLKAVKSEMSKHIELTRQEVGCLVFEISQNINQSNLFEVYEEFADRESFELHQRRVASSKWGLVTKNVKRQYQVNGL
jgi:(4S)-4-hydroxy-5-phosphonooxypentane-2,3-dione isomerase